MSLKSSARSQPALASALRGQLRSRAHGSMGFRIRALAGGGLHSSHRCMEYHGNSMKFMEYVVHHPVASTSRRAQRHEDEDLELLHEHQLLAPGAVLVADNVLSTGAAGFLWRTGRGRLKVRGGGTESHRAQAPNPTKMPEKSRPF